MLVERTADNQDDGGGNNDNNDELDLHVNDEDVVVL